MIVRLSVIIPTYNRCSLVTRTLDSLLSQTHEDFEVIVVDDGSVDKTRESVKPYVDGTTRYIRTPHRGTPFAWNLGVKESTQKHLFFLGDDVVLQQDCLALLARTMEAADQNTLGAVGPRLIYTRDTAKPTEERGCQRYPYLQPSTGDVASCFNVDAQGLMEVPILHGYSVVVKEAFLSVGGFDEKTYTGNYFREETDLWLRFRLKGYRLYYQPKAKIYCQKSLIKGGQWSNVNGKRSTYEYYVVRNHSRFLSKFYGRERFLMLPAFVIRRLYTRLLEAKGSRQN